MTIFLLCCLLSQSPDVKEDGTFKVGPVAKGRDKIQALVERPRAEADLVVETDGKEVILVLKPNLR